MDTDNTVTKLYGHTLWFAEADSDEIFLQEETLYHWSLHLLW